jgi:hypothetical protein
MRCRFVIDDVVGCSRRPRSTILHTSSDYDECFSFGFPRLSYVYKLCGTDQGSSAMAKLSSAARNATFCTTCATVYRQDPSHHRGQSSNRVPRIPGMKFLRGHKHVGVVVRLQLGDPTSTMWEVRSKQQLREYRILWEGANKQ